MHFTRRAKRKIYVHFVVVIWFNPLIECGCLDSTTGDEDKKDTLRHMRGKDGRKHLFENISSLDCKDRKSGRVQKKE